MSVTAEVFAQWESEDTRLFGWPSRADAMYRKVDKDKKADKKGLAKVDAMRAMQIKKLKNEIALHSSEYRSAKTRLTTAYDELTKAVSELKKVSESEVPEQAQDILDKEKGAIDMLRAAWDGMDDEATKSGSGY